jgi:hypothetical protein
MKKTIEKVEASKSVEDVKNSGLYEYSQNNSGGSFTVDDEVTIRVYIEADSAGEANRKAEEFGIYFDGYGDCPCCGNRWQEASEPDCKDVQELETRFDGPGWRAGQNYFDSYIADWVKVGEAAAYVYLKDGSKISYLREAEEAVEV